MKKIIILFLFIFIIVGCDKDNNTNIENGKYEEKSITYKLGEEKVLIEAVPAKKAYTEKKKEGKTTSWGRKSRYVVGKDIKPGYYDIESSGWASYGIYVYSLEIDLDSTANNFGSYFLVPNSGSVCYMNDDYGCDSLYDEYKKIKGVLLEKGDKIYVHYTKDSMQNIKIRFVAKERTIKHPATEAIPEVKGYPIEVKESIKKYKDNIVCYINDYKTDCKSLNNYDEIIKMF